MNFQINLLFLGVMLLFSFQYVVGQATLQGVVKDTVNQREIHDATVTILTRTDSMLRSFAYTDQSGKFLLTNLTPNTYIIIVSKKDYVDLIDTIDVLEENTLLDVISLIPKSILIEEVLIQEDGAVVIRGDTTEYNVDRFKVPENASIEDMLKILPGMEVDRQGTVSVNGQRINKVFVDGEEFFSDDYTLVTKNFKSKMVDKVQVYDHSSSFAGEKTKVVNLKLKEDSKNGVFGKVIAGGGPQSMYESQLMVNRFKGKLKASVYGTLSNTNLLGLGGKNREVYNEGIDESVSYDVDLDTWDGNYNALGLPRNASVGAHFSNRFDEDKQYLSVNYKLSSLQLDVIENTISEMNLIDDNIYSEINSSADNNRLNNTFNADYEIKIDSSSVLKLGLSASSNTKNSISRYDSYQLNNEMDTINAGFRNIDSRTRYQRLLVDANFEKYLGTRRRILGVDLSQHAIDQHSEGTLLSMYSAGGGIDGFDPLNINQDRSNSSLSNYYKGKLYYKEPINQYLDLVFNYRIDYDRNRSGVETFNANNLTVSNLDSTLSGVYDFNRLISRGGLSVEYKNDKVKLVVASDIGFQNLEQQDQYTNMNIDRNFVYVYPKLSFKYSFSLQKSIEFRYDGSVVQPAVQFLQPIANNIDPLNVYLGNTTIIPYYKQTYYLAYNNWIPVGKKYIFSNFSFTTLDNPIGMNISTNAETGQSTYQYANFGSGYQYNGYLGIGKSITILKDGSLGANLDVNGYRNNILLNGVLNDVRSSVYSFAPSVFGNVSKALRIGVYPKISYNVNQTSVQQNDVGNFWQYNLSGYISLTLPYALSISADADYELRQGNETFNENVDFLIISPKLEKKFLKDKNLALGISAHDILNQRIGFTRSMSYNAISQRTYNALSRYYLISLTWDFTKMKTL